MAQATLNSALELCRAEFALGLVADEDDFARFLAHAISSCDEGPDFISDDVTDPMDDEESGAADDMLSGAT